MDHPVYPDVSMELAPEIYGAFRTFSQRVFADGAMCRRARPTRTRCSRSIR